MHCRKIKRVVDCRGGFEDTRLEAKATKKIRGQGQPFRGQTLSRRRTGMLEAKAKDQGHKRKCSPKKKGLHKNFSGDLKKKKRSSQKFLKRSPQKNVFQKIFQALHTILTIQKLRNWCCPRAEDRPIFEDLRPRGQGLDLRGQGLQNVSSRTPPLVTSSRDIPKKLIFTEKLQVWHKMTWYSAVFKLSQLHNLILLHI